MVNTKAGVFSCYHYQFILDATTLAGSTSQVADDIFIAPNVGIIKVVEPTDGVFVGVTASNPVLTTTVLKDYKLN